MVAAFRVDVDRPKRWRRLRQTQPSWTWTRVWPWHASHSSASCWSPWSSAVPKLSWTPTVPSLHPPGRSNTWTTNRFRYTHTHILVLLDVCSPQECTHISCLSNFTSNRVELSDVLMQILILYDTLIYKCMWSHTFWNSLKAFRLFL